MIKERFITYVEDSIKKNWNKEALSNYREKGYTYKEIAEMIVSHHIFFQELGIKEGDKIALVGRNSANWCAMYLAVVTYGAIVVPILPDFRPEDMMNIINHSDSKLIFIDDKLWEGLESDRLKEIMCAVSLDAFDITMSRAEKYAVAYNAKKALFGKKYPDFKQEDIKFSGKYQLIH